MIEILYYGNGHDSQRVIDAVNSVVDVDVAYRFEPASVREDNRSAWGAKIASESVDESAVTDAIEAEFGSVTKA